MNLPQRVTIREVAPRDGFQSWPEFVPTTTKVQVIEAVIAAGVTQFETTAFVSPKAVPQMSDAEAVLKSVPRGKVTHGALIPNLKGAQLAVAAGVNQLNVVISASEAHNMANFKRPIADSLAALEPIFKLAADNRVQVIGAVAVAFGCPFAGEVPARDVLKLIDAYVSLGADFIALADTTGMATPRRIQNLIGLIRDRFPQKEMVLHLHNNRGSAMANLYAGLQAGVTIFDTALGGIGGCPNVPQASGNLATEDVVCMLEDMGIHTGVDLAVLLDAARLLEKCLGRELPGQVLKSGPIMPAPPQTCCGLKAAAH
jgi:hydroxymethylglutaryl-CoA lyase